MMDFGVVLVWFIASRGHWTRPKWNLFRFTPWIWKLSMFVSKQVSLWPSSMSSAGRRRNLDLAHSVPMCMFWWSFRPKIHGGSWWILGLCWFGSLPAEDIELGQSETCLETNMDSFQIHGVNLSESAVFWRQWSWLGPHIFWNQVSRWHHFKLLQVEWPTHLVSLDLLKMHRLFALFYPPMLETLLGTCSMLDPWCRSKISTRCFPLHAGQAQQWEADRFSQLT